MLLADGFLFVRFFGYLLGLVWLYGTSVIVGF